MFFSFIKRKKKNDLHDTLWKWWKENAPKICPQSFPLEKKTFPIDFHTSQMQKFQTLTP